MAIFSEGHGGIPWLMAQSCAPCPTKKLKMKNKHINKKNKATAIRTKMDKHDNHQGGILPADSFPFCASLRRRFATKTGFLIPEGKGRIIAGQ